MERIDRRSFVGALGTLAAAGVMPAAARADEKAHVDEKISDDGAASSVADDGDGSSAGDIATDVQRLSERGGTSLTLAELNAIRHERVDGLGDLTCEDSTVIPAVWHKLAVLTDLYGIGASFLVTVSPEHLARYMRDLFHDDEEGAAHYLEMPWGKEFSIYEYAQASGREPAECEEICNDLADRALLYRAVRSDGAYFHHMPIIHGFVEYSVEHLRDPEMTKSFYDNLLDAANPNPTISPANMVTAGTPIYYSVPCDRSVVADERVLPLNDYETMLDRFDTICVMPCICSMHQNMAAGADIPPSGTKEFQEFRNVFEGKKDGEGHHLERCLAFGEQAEYYLSVGVGRQITKDEARAIIERNVDEGLVLQMGYTNDSDILCSCHGDCCSVLETYIALGPEMFAQSPLQKNASNYLLQYDRDACIQCGACIDRCPMSAISMDDTNHPTVNMLCVRCGQCGLVCPVHARTLTARPEDDRLPVPDTHMDDHNRKFGFRVEHDMLA